MAVPSTPLPQGRKCKPLVCPRLTKHMPIRNLTFAVAVNDREILESNLLASPCLQSREPQVLLQRQFPSAATAYNDAMRRSVNDLIVFCHQDIFLPEGWLEELDRAIAWLTVNDPEWSVLGCIGMTADGEMRGQVYSSGLGVIGTKIHAPAVVQTLDEIVLILRISSRLQFDEALRHFHFYGADICLRAQARGGKCYAVPAFCVHNTQHNLVLPKEFYDGYGHVKQTWESVLPIHTTCISITRSDLPLYQKRIHEAYHRYIRRNEVHGRRVVDVQHLFRKIAGEMQ